MADIPEPRTKREARRWVRIYWSRWLAHQDCTGGNDWVFEVFTDETQRIARRISPPQEPRE
jgi:hypothetical protein